MGVTSARGYDTVLPVIQNLSRSLLRTSTKCVGNHQKGGEDDHHRDWAKALFRHDACAATSQATYDHITTNSQYQSLFGGGYFMLLCVWKLDDIPYQHVQLR